MFCDNKNVGYDPHTEVKHNLINKTKTAFNFNSKTVQKQKTVKIFPPERGEKKIKNVFKINKLFIYEKL